MLGQVKVGYLKCDECGGYYELQDGESIDDFDGCECGGKYKEINSHIKEDESKSDSISLENEKINWKYCIIGAALVVVLALVLKMFEYGAFIGMFIPGIIVGYLVNNGYKNGAKNGIITGIIGGFILGILQITFDPILSPLLIHGLSVIFVFALFTAVFSAILDAVGGIIGALIRDKI